MTDNLPSHPGWDTYWASNPKGSQRLYSAIASVYRQIFICPRLAYWLKRVYPAGSRLLHAGCGSGEVDAWVSKDFQITGLDISPLALERYRRSNPRVERTIHADLMRLDNVHDTYDGVYSLGVLEHFSEQEIAIILGNIRRVMKPGGKMIAFWPLESAPSVKVLGLWHRLINRSGERVVELHPPELSLARSREYVERIVTAGGWRVTEYSVSPADLYVQAVVVCE